MCRRASGPTSPTATGRSSTGGRDWRPRTLGGPAPTAKMVSEIYSNNTWGGPRSVMVSLLTRMQEVRGSNPGAAKPSLEPTSSYPASRLQRCVKGPWKGWCTRKQSTRDDKKTTWNWNKLSYFQNLPLPSSGPQERRRTRRWSSYAKVASLSWDRCEKLVFICELGELTWGENSSPYFKTNFFSSFHCLMLTLRRKLFTLCSAENETV